jgi:glycosyltransferase involved in cell wall biosynthesis
MSTSFSARSLECSRAGGAKSRAETHIVGDSVETTAPPRFTIHHFGPDTRDTGGIETVMRNAAIFSIGADRVYVHATRSADGWRRTLRLAAGSLWSLMQLDGGDIAHVHLSHRGSYLREGAFVMLARLHGLPTVVTSHGSQFQQFARKHPRIVTFVMNQADVVLCLSREGSEVVTALAPGVDCRTVRNAVPSDLESPPAGTTGKTVLFAGEIGTRKGVDVLLNAWPLVLRRHPDAKLVLAGRATALDVQPQQGVVNMGELTPSGVSSLIRQARVIALPSRYEAMPMILSEALAAGRPFVSTPVAGIPDLAHGVQALVPVGDHSALAEELNRLLDDPLLAETRGEAAREFHRNNISVERIDRELREIYTTAMARNHAHQVDRCQAA